jgi:hypothetical protein
MYRQLRLLLVLAACGAPDPADTGDAATTTTDPSGSTTEPTTGVAPGPTYYQDIAPILGERCVGCHVAGGAAPFSLATYAEAGPLAPVLATSIEAGTMPPWPPGGATPPLHHDRSLPADERVLVLEWIAAGAPEGDPSNPAPLREPERVVLPSVDLATDIGTDYVPDDSLTDDYHCFVIDLGTAEDRVALGYQWTPGNGKTVHHVLSTLFTPGSAAAIAAVDDAAPGPGWPCFAGYSNIPDAEPVGPLGGWVPGVAAANYPQGTGVYVPAGALLVVQIHYNLGGGTDPDRTRLDVAFAPKDAEAGLQLLKTKGYPWPGFMLPAGAKDLAVTRELPPRVDAKTFPDGDAYIVGVAGHMHLLGTAFSLTRKTEGGDLTILEIPRWDFHWQGSYALVEPIKLTKDDKVEIRCVYDNSAEHRAAVGMGPPVDVTWGEGTEDEMCLGYLQLIDELP